MTITDLPIARATDAVRLWHDVGLTRPWNDPVVDLRRALDGPASTVLAAWPDHQPEPTGGELIGTAMVGHDGHRGWMYYLAVDVAHRREGWGRRLVTACEAWLTDRNVPAARLMVRAENVATVEFYRGLGYEPSEVLVLGRRLDV